MNYHYTYMVSDETFWTRFYSTNSLSDLGYYFECKNETDGGFVVMNAGLADMSGVSRKGKCMPKECQ